MKTSSFEIELTKSAAKEFKKLSADVKKRAIEAFEFLSKNPYSELLKVKKLKGPESLYRVCIGDYRIVYEVRNHKLLILIIKTGHRREVYRNL